MALGGSGLKKSHKEKEKKEKKDKRKSEKKEKKEKKDETTIRDASQAPRGKQPTPG